jgi:O-antigen/teichoic acid export membrane protein
MTAVDVPLQGEQPAPPDRRRIATNFVTLAVTGALGLVVTLLISIYVRRMLGPTAMGQVSWSLAIIGYLGMIVNPGLTPIGERELARNRLRGNELLALVLTLQTAFSAIVYALLVVFAAFDLRGPAVSILLLIQGLTLFLTAWNSGWVLQAYERMVIPSVASLVINALQLPVLLLFVHSPDDTNLYAFLALPFALAGVIFNFWYMIRRGAVRSLRLRPTFAGSARLLREAWPVALAQAAILILQTSGIIILGFTSGDNAVGQYATAHRLIMVASLGTAALWNAFFPALARSSTVPDHAAELSREFLGLLAWIGFPLAALGWACGRHVVELMYGAAFAESGLYFEWLSLSIALTYLYYGLVAILMPLGRSTLQFQIIAVAAAVNLALNAIAIPLYGPWGSIAAMLAAETVLLGLGLAMRNRGGLLNHAILPVVAPPLLCSLGVAVVIVLLPPSWHHFWWFELTSGAVVLLICLIGFERDALRRMVSGLDRTLENIPALQSPKMSKCLKN